MRTNLNAKLMRSALVAALLTLSACAGAGGSCLLSSTASDGYLICEDYSGTEYNQGIGKNSCETAGGVYSPDPCSTAGALGSCLVFINTAKEYAYTYLPSGTGSASQVTLQSACGVAGGTYSAN
jgi:hypothetical protein